MTYVVTIKPAEEVMPLYDRSTYLTVEAKDEIEAEAIFDNFNGTCFRPSGRTARWSR